MNTTIEDIFIKADFARGSNHKATLRDCLFISKGKGNMVQFPTGRELSEDELGMISAAGLFEDCDKKADTDHEQKYEHQQQNLRSGRA